mgnify:CR=1 FL=1
MNKFKINYVVSRFNLKTDEFIDRACVIVEKNSEQVHLGCRYFNFTFKKDVYVDFFNSDENLIREAVDILSKSSLTSNYYVSRAFEFTDTKGDTRLFGLIPKCEDCNCRMYLVEFSFPDMREKEYPKTVDVDKYLNLEDTKKVLEKLLELNKIDDDAFCFTSETGAKRCFFLPLDKVKKDKSKEKKYRPIKSLVELSIAIYGELNHFKTVCMGNDLFIRLKGCKNYERVLITHLEFDNNHALVAINGNTLKTLFENYELRNDKGEYVPFGVEVEDEYSSF